MKRIFQLWKPAAETAETAETAEKEPEQDAAASGAVEDEQAAAIARVMDAVQYYRNQARVYLTVLLLALAVFASAAFLGGIALYVMWDASNPRYFAVNPDGSIKRIPALDEPVIPDAQVASWAAKAVLRTFTMAFTTWKDDLLSVRRYYTEDAYLELFQFLYHGEKLIPYIEDNRLNMVATLESAAHVVRTGVLNGRKVWDIEFKFRLSMEGGTGTKSGGRLVAKVIVERADLHRHPEGLLIRRIIVSPDTSS